MKYFIYEHERKNTVDHEFQKGHFDGHTFGKSDSIFLSDDCLFTIGMLGFFKSVIPCYNDHSEFEIGRELWGRIVKKAQEVGGEVPECISEADKWAEETFREYDVFTIIGV